MTRTYYRVMTVNVPVSWDAPLEQWGAWMRAADRPATTRYLRDYEMRRFAADHGGPPWEVTLDDMVAWLGGKTWASQTKRAYRAGLRAFYSWAHVTGRITSNPAGLLPTIKTPIRLPRPAPEPVLAAALLAAGPRVRLMVLLAGHEGLRRGEIAQVNTADLERDLFGTSLRVHGKGAKERLVPLSPELTMLLRAAPKGYVFPGQIDGHLSPHYVGKLVSGVLGPGWTTHTLRHRFATVTYAGAGESGGDLLEVQKLLGHAKPETTLGYVLVLQPALRRTAAAAWAA